MQVFPTLSRRSLLSINPVANFQHHASLIGTRAVSGLPQQTTNPSFCKNDPTWTLLSNRSTTRGIATTRSTLTILSNSFPVFPFNPFRSSSRATSTMVSAPIAAVDQLVKLTSDLSLTQIRDKFPACYPETNPTDVYRLHLTKVLEKITGVDPNIIYPAVQWTQGLDKGDLMLAVPALRVKGKKPNELAEEWGTQFPEDDPLVHKPNISGVHLSFSYKTEPLTKAVIPMVRALGKKYGNNPALGFKDSKNPDAGRKRIIVEFSSPNIAKPFHAGHLRSTIIGGFIANLHEGAGWDVVRINYLGDWGKQYGLLALGFERYGSEEELLKDPINHLFHLYVRINNEIKDEEEKMKALKEEGKEAEAAQLKESGLDEQARKYFKKMVDGDEAALKMWRRFRDLSIERYKKTYARLNIHFDSYSGESQVPESAMEAAAKKMEEKGISSESDGARIVDFASLIPGKEGKRLERPIIRKKDGTALYLTRDISELMGRYEKYKYDQMIYVVASQQDLHLKQLFKIVELMGDKDVADRCQHINFGMVLGMSTRKGTVKFLDDILRDVGDKMHEVMRKNEDKYAQVENPDAVADTLGISSVMIQDMTGKRINNYTFNMDAMTSFEGDTGPYLQYAHARVCSIERRAAIPAEELEKADLTLLKEPHAINLARVLSQYPDVVQNTLKTLEPTTVVTYLFKLTHVLSSSYDVLRIVGTEEETKKARMALYDAARIVIANGMRLLGLTPVERM